MAIMAAWGVRVLVVDPAGIDGNQVNVHNSLWPRGDDDDWDPNGKSKCTIIGPCAEPYKFPSSRVPASAYIIECDGFLYPIRTAALASYLPIASYAPYAGNRPTPNREKPRRPGRPPRPPPGGSTVATP